MTIHSGSNDQHLVRLALAITATAEILGHEITPAAIEMMARDLCEYPARQVADALKACRRELKGRLTLAAILERITELDGHPEPNEAWAIALRACDERQSVGMTRQISAALYAAGPVLSTGDKVGARMAFLDAYKRELSQVRQDKQPAGWFVSSGWDAQGRVDEIERMASAGLIQQEERQRLLTEHRAGQPQGDAVIIAGLITGRVPPDVTPSEEARKHIEKIRRLLHEHRAAEEDKAQQQRERTARLKSETAAKVQVKLAQEEPWQG